MLVSFTFTGDKAWASAHACCLSDAGSPGPAEPGTREERTMETAERIRLLVAPLIADTDAELYDIEFGGGVLRITVDQPGGVDMGVIGRLTRAISRQIDETDPIPGQFTLEVSSPGLERPLRTAEHFRRAIGETVSIKTRPGLEGDRRFKATVVAVGGDDDLTLAPLGAPADQVRHLALDDVERARTVFEWGPAPKPGRPKAAPGGPPTSPSAKKKKAAKS